MRRMMGGGPAPDANDATALAFFRELYDLIHDLDATRPATSAAVMGCPVEWMKMADVVLVNRYWGWYVMQGQLDKACAMLDQELDDTWEMFGKPVIVSEFGADTQPGLHGHPALMWTEEYQAAFLRGYLEVAARKDFVVGMHVWNFAAFAAIQSVMRVGGQNMKGVFTRTRQPKMAAHVLRESGLRAKPRPIRYPRQFLRPNRLQPQQTPRSLFLEQMKFSPP